jgi:broad specificity phosphatase PhoE
MLRFRLLCAALLALSATPLRAQQQPTVVILVRHGEKDLTNPADRDPALSAAGTARAAALWQAVRASGVNAVITTQLRRTVLTGQVTADSLHLSGEVVPAAATTAAQVAERVRTLHAGHTVLVVGHSNTIPETIAALGGPTVTICDAQYSQLFVLVLRPGGAPTLVQTHYGAADPAGAEVCAPAH